MKSSILIVFVFFSHLCGPSISFAQELVLDSANVSNAVQVDKIFIVGNRKTKEKIILREMQIKEGDFINRSELKTLLEQDKNNIQNTRLFLTVNTNIIEVDARRIDIIIRVAERWYLFPAPIFELADRNFNEWWINQNHDFSRVNYGLKLFRYNMRGHNETLKLLAQFGFNKKFQVMYSFPYIDRSQKVGLSIIGEFIENDNFYYTTLGDKLQNLDFHDNKWMLRESKVGIVFSYRRSFYNSHHLGLEYFYNRIKDTVALLNPNYFTNGALDQKYLQLQYTFIRDLRDVSAYPLKGFIMKVNARKLGLGLGDIDQFEISGNYAHYLPLGNKFYFSTEIGGITSMPKQQPYHNFNALGFEPFDIRGYELFVIEGQHLLYNRNTLKKQIFQKDFVNHFMPIRQFQILPLAIYLKTFFDFGYVNNSLDIPEGSRFTNTPLWGAGVGLDVVTYYDMSLRLEYSMNKEFEKSFVLGIKRDF